MYTRLLKTASLLVVGMVLSVNALAAGADKPKEETGPAETGPVKAAKESTAFDDFLDDETLLGGKFTTWVEFASDYVFHP